MCESTEVEVLTTRHRERRGLARSSAVVREARLLSASERRVLGVTDFQLDVADLCFSAIQLLLDDRDPRPMWERLEDLEDHARDVFGSVDLDRLQIDDDGNPVLPRWLRRASAPGYGRFVRRFLGAARADRMVGAFRQDGEVFAVAVRRCLRYLLPVAAAADRCIRVLSPSQQAQIEGIEGLARSTALALVVRLDSAVTELEADGVLLDPGIARPSELAELSGPVGELARSMDTLVSDQSAEIIQGFGTMLTRKVQGARDALALSSDPISQAANSVVELIDRTLRHAFETEHVLRWIDQHFSSRSTVLTREKDGRRLPTKRGMALCFACAGEAPPEQPMIHELAAAAIVTARDELEHLKHADKGTEAEKEEVITMLKAVEGSILLVSRIAWIGVDESSLDDLRNRLVLAA